MHPPTSARGAALGPESAPESAESAESVVAASVAEASVAEWSAPPEPKRVGVPVAATRVGLVAVDEESALSRPVKVRYPARGMEGVVEGSPVATISVVCVPVGT